MHTRFYAWPLVTTSTPQQQAQAATAALLLQQADIMERFGKHPEARCLRLEP